MAALLAGAMTWYFSKRVRLSRAQHATSGIVAAVVLRGASAESGAGTALDDEAA